MSFFCFQSTWLFIWQFFLLNTKGGNVCSRNETVWRFSFWIYNRICNISFKCHRSRRSGFIPILAIAIGLHLPRVVYHFIFPVVCMVAKKELRLKIKGVLRPIPSNFCRFVRLHRKCTCNNDVEGLPWSWLRSCDRSQFSHNHQKCFVFGFLHIACPEYRSGYMGIRL